MRVAHFVRMLFGTILGLMTPPEPQIALGTFLVYFYGIMVHDAETNTTTGPLVMLGYCALFSIMLTGLVNRVFEVCLLTLPGQIFAAIGGHFAGMSGEHEKHGNNVGVIIGKTQSAISDGLGAQGKRDASKVNSDMKEALKGIVGAGSNSTPKGER